MIECSAYPAVPEAPPDTVDVPGMGATLTDEAEMGATLADDAGLVGTTVTVE